MLSAEEDQFNCVININSGAGGTESQDWSEMLMRMYIMYADKKALKHRWWMNKRAMVQVLNRAA